MNELKEAAKAVLDVVETMRAWIERRDGGGLNPNEKAAVDRLRAAIDKEDAQHGPKKVKLNLCIEDFWHMAGDVLVFGGDTINVILPRDLSPLLRARILSEMSSSDSTGKDSLLSNEKQHPLMPDDELDQINEGLCGTREFHREYGRRVIGKLVGNPVGYQFEAENGNWYVLDDKHLADVRADGRWPIRQIFAGPIENPVGINGLTEAETSASASVMGLVKPTASGPSNPQEYSTVLDDAIGAATTLSNILDRDSKILADVAPVPESVFGNADLNELEVVKDAVHEALGNALDCGRVWSAWQAGTMSQDDFSSVSEDEDRLTEISTAAIKAVNRVRSVSDIRSREVMPAKTVGVLHPDDAAVDAFAAVMKDRMSLQRARGRKGWGDPAACPVDRLENMLLENFLNGDFVDVGNLAMMILTLRERASKEAS